MGIDWESVGNQLLRAEDEEIVHALLADQGLLQDDHWQPLGGFENNFSIVGAQHSDPTGALVEKLINGVDAVLMAACRTAGLDPEGPGAPQSMGDAVEKFFGVRGGRLASLGKHLGALATHVQLVATGAKDSPSYLVIDDGEGQTPDRFPETFLSLVKSNKLRIPFVQGKFNSGGTGVLPFCGRRNYQLIISRRNPACLDPSDSSSAQWGFTLIRRLEPTAGDGRRNSLFVYLAPNGEVPRFESNGIHVLPGPSKKNTPCQAYAQPIPHGTAIKLYNYRWKARSIATTEARFELEKYLHAPSLPLRISETRDFRANYYQTSLSGVWAGIDTNDDDEDRRVEPNFPAPGTLAIDGIGNLSYELAVFKPEVNSRKIPHGLFFSVNGQVHGDAPADFVSRQLEFEHLNGYLLVSLDCTEMETRVRNDFFMSSRDRLRRDETYDVVLGAIRRELKEHPGLRTLNAARRARAMEKALGDNEEVQETFQLLLNADPTLEALLSPGAKLVTKVGPADTELFEGARFPSFFRLAKEPQGGLVRDCPINRSIKIDFETDARNDYFERSDTPGEMTVTPASSYADYRPWNGVFTLRFKPPLNAAVGDVVQLAVTVSDADREARGKSPFVATLQLRISKRDDARREGGEPNKQSRASTPGGGQDAPRLATPNVKEIRRSEWMKFTPHFDEHEPFRVISDGEGGFDYVLNLENEFLLTQLRDTRGPDKQMIHYWFKWGLTLAAMGLMAHLKHPAAREGDSDGIDLSIVNSGLSGMARVVVPIVRGLYKGPG